MSELPRFKHRPVGPRKGTGSVALPTINPSKRKRQKDGTVETEYLEVHVPLAELGRCRHAWGKSDGRTICRLCGWVPPQSGDAHGE